MTDPHLPGRAAADRATSDHAVADLATVLDRSEVVLAGGPGGVGKTTTAAARAGAAARRGRRGVVVTVDPARRLADSLGVAEVGNEPRLVLPPTGTSWPGSLSALMLDTASTFDALVRSQSTSTEQAEAILGNPMYRNISGALSGTQEYMAVEKLHELHRAGDFDLVVVDTPPSRNAIDLLEAPGRLVRFLEHPIYRLLTAPSRSALRAFGAAARLFLRTLRGIAGAEIVEDAVEFFQAFAGMEDGFRRRAADVDRMLREPSTSFVVVSSPRDEALREAGHLIGELRARDMTVDAVVVNLVHPEPGAVEASRGDHGALRALLTLHDRLTTLALDERERARRLVAADSSTIVTELPLLDHDVHDLDGLGELASLLVPGDVGTEG